MNRRIWASSAPTARRAAAGVFGRLGRAFGRLVRDRRGVEAIEFAMIAPVLLVMTIGALEIGILMFEYHRAAEATRSGARIAVIEDPIATVEDLKTAGITCTGAGGAVNCAGGAVILAGAFTAVLNEMRVTLPDLASENIQVLYEPSTVLADDTSGLVTPLITVRIVNYTYDLSILSFIPGVPATITFPPFGTTLLGASFIIPIP